MTDITMPKLSDSMEEGTILSWLKAAGDEVAVGEDLVEVETDKATVTHPAEAAGVLDIVVPEGTSVAVGVVIGRVGVGAAAPPAAATAPADAAAPADASPAANAAPSAATAAPADAAASPAATAAPAATNGRGAGTGVATPVARRVADVHGVALSEVQGTGPLGRITRADVLSKAGVVDTASILSSGPAPSPAPAAPPAPAPTATPAPAADRPGTSRQEPTRLQQTIARRMAEAKATIPHFQVETEVAMDAAIALRSELKALAGDDQPVPSFNDIIIKAAAAALLDHPLANGSYKDGAFELHEDVNIGMAVAADNALVVPTIFDTARKSLGAIARDTRAAAARVRSGEITPPELSGGTFTVSNLGMFGMTAITPVINPPQAAILGVGAFRPTLTRDTDGEIIDRTLLTLTLSCDHRILYGADAARFLAQIRDLLETPLKLAL